MLSYHMPWACVHFLLSLPLNAWSQPKMDCSECARDVSRSMESWSFPENSGVGSEAIHAWRLVIIAIWTGGGQCYYVTSIC